MCDGPFLDLYSTPVETNLKQNLFLVLYLTHGRAVFQGPQRVRIVETDAIHAHRLLVLLAVELQRLQVQVACLLRGPVLVGPPVRVLQEGLAGAAERSVGDGLLFLDHFPTHRALLVELPTLLQTHPAEAVGAGQQHGVLEYALTHGASQVLLER